MLVRRGRPVPGSLVELIVPVIYFFIRVLSPISTFRLFSENILRKRNQLINQSINWFICMAAQKLDWNMHTTRTIHDINSSTADSVWLAWRFLITSVIAVSSINLYVLIPGFRSSIIIRNTGRPSQDPRGIPPRTIIQPKKTRRRLSADSCCRGKSWSNQWWCLAVL